MRHLWAYTVAEVWEEYPIERAMNFGFDLAFGESGQVIAWPDGM